MICGIGLGMRCLAVALATGFLISSTALAGAGGIPDSAPAAVARKVAAHGELWSKLSADLSKKLPVIVHFAQPPVLPSASFATAEEADTALTRSIHAAQDAILNDLFPAAVLSAAMAEESNVKRMNFVPMFGMVAGAEEVAALAANPDVVSVVEDVAYPPALTDYLSLIGMPQVFAAGFSGSGYHVAILDTGTRRAHKFLNSRIVSEACYNTNNAPEGVSSRCPGGATEAVGAGTAEDCQDPQQVDGCGHGTHIAGIAAGFNTDPQQYEPTSGVARDARMISINIFSRVDASTDTCRRGYPSCLLAYSSDQIKGLERVYELRNSMSIAAVSMSLSKNTYTEYCDDDPQIAPQRPIIDLLRAAGIATVVPVGNEFRSSAVGSPACISSAIAVAGSNQNDNRYDTSNWGRLVDLAAPGGAVLSSYIFDSDNDEFGGGKGTSVATAFVAGAFAVLREVKPTATVSQIANTLKNTGRPVLSFGTTKPRIDVNAARIALQNGTDDEEPQPAMPVNNDFFEGTTITALGTVVGSNIGADDQPGEPPHAYIDSARNSVWWRFTPLQSGAITISTRGSSFDTVLAVYTGSFISTLTPIASNDNDPSGGGGSSVSFQGTAGTRYNIMVAGNNGASGSISLTVQGGGGAGGLPVIVAATTPVARAAAVGQTVTAFATILNAGGDTGISCIVGKPTSGSFPFNFSFQTRDHVTGALGTVNTPVNIAAGGRQDFLMIFTSTAPMSTNVPMRFDCSNSEPVASVSGLNTFLLTASTTAPADVVSTAVTPTLDGLLRVPNGGTGIAALAANNIGALASLQARLSSSPIGGSAPALPLGLSMCRTNPSTGACITAQAGTIDFTANPNEIITFTAFATYGGSAIPFSPADRRLFIHFYQGSTPVGSASVAVCTIGAANCAASGSSSQTAELAASTSP